MSPIEPPSAESGEQEGEHDDDPRLRFAAEESEDAVPKASEGAGARVFGQSLSTLVTSRLGGTAKARRARRKAKEFGFIPTTSPRS